MDLLEILEQYQLQRRYLSIFTVAVLAALNGSSKKRLTYPQTLWAF